jgi:hypothetical protein
MNRLFLSYVNYQDIETFAPRDHNEIIPCFANHQWPTGSWGDQSRLRTPETLIPLSRIDNDAPGMETHSPDAIPDFAAEPTAEEDDDDRDSIPETPGHPDHTHRRAPLKLDELHTEGLNSAQIALIHEWFSQAALRDGVSCHDQILEISLQLCRLMPRPSFQRIGLVFGLNRGTIDTN